MNRFPSLFVAVTILGLSFASTHAGQGSYDVSWFTIDGGGTTSNAGGNAFSVSGTIAQPDARAPMSGDLFALQPGFWPGGPVVEMPCDQWTLMNTGIDGPVRALVVYNGQVIAGGDFTSAGGLAANNIARWNGSFWEPLGTGLDNDVLALAVYNNELIAGGTFTMAGGQPANSIARWNGSTWQPLGNGFPGQVSTMVEYNGQLIASGGLFTPSGNGIASWNGSAWTLLGPSGLFYWVAYALTVYNGDLIAAGYFEVHVPPVRFLAARWTGSTWQPLGTAPIDWSNGPSFVSAATVHDDELFVGGQIDVGSDHVGLLRWNGSAWQIDDDVEIIYNLTAYNNALVATGYFNWNEPLPVSGIGRWDGSTWQSIGPIGATTGTALTVHNDHLVLTTKRWRDCPCSPDINGNGTVNVEDLLIVISAWGPCPIPSNCPADIAPPGGNDVVNVEDLLGIIGAWGPCP